MAQDARGQEEDGPQEGEQGLCRNADQTEREQHEPYHTTGQSASASNATGQHNTKRRHQPTNVSMLSPSLILTFPRNTGGENSSHYAQRNKQQHTVR